LSIHNVFYFTISVKLIANISTLSDGNTTDALGIIRTLSEVKETEKSDGSSKGIYFLNYIIISL
jgi:hypothetical protein